MSSTSKGDDKIRFRTTDPKNREIIMKEQTWTEHIAPRHNETDEIKIQKNIENPSLIVRNMKRNDNGELIIDEKREDYIGLINYSTADGKQSLKIIKTIVEIVDDENGFVVTNYILRNLKEIKTEGGIVYDSKESINL